MSDASSDLKRVRAVGKIEGISFILLMGVAMPLKYFAGLPEAVKWCGWLHGILFLAFVLVLLQALLSRGISFGKAVLAFIAALLPFGPFLIDRYLAKAEA